MRIPRSGIALILALILAGAAGCGQQGPLFLPEPRDQGDVVPDENEDQNEEDTG